MTESKKVRVMAEVIEEVVRYLVYQSTEVHEPIESYDEEQNREYAERMNVRKKMYSILAGHIDGNAVPLIDQYMREDF